MTVAGMINFFLPMTPPTVTQQEHEFKIVKGKVIVYDPPRLKDARQKFTTLLAGQKPWGRLRSAYTAPRPRMVTTMADIPIWRTFSARIAPISSGERAL